jgi:hypothetical protein
MDLYETMVANQQCEVVFNTHAPFPDVLVTMVRDFVGCFHVFDNLQNILEAHTARLKFTREYTGWAGFELVDRKCYTQELDDVMPYEEEDVCAITDGIHYSYFDIDMLMDDNEEMNFTPIRHPVEILKPPKRRNGKVTFREVLNFIGTAEDEARRRSVERGKLLDVFHQYFEGVRAIHHSNLSYPEETYSTVWTGNWGS